MAAYHKALVPLVVMGVLGVLGFIGVRPEMKVEDALTLLVTAGLVWWVPNKKK